MKLYYFHDGQREQGPFNLEDLKEKGIRTQTPIWYEGLQSWTTAGEVYELKSIFNNGITPPPLNNNRFEKAGEPPLFAQTSNTSRYAESTFPKSRNALKVPLLIVCVFIIVLTSWVVFDNSKDTILPIDTGETTTTVTEINDVEAVEKEAKRLRINQANTLKNMNFRNKWESYIKIQNSEPNIDYTLGGISPFTINVYNETSYMLDQVDIYVQYIRKNGQLYQTKTVTVLNVPAGSSAYADAPASINGVKVSCTIEKIVSKKMHFCYPENNGNPEDPYFCK